MIVAEQPRVAKTPQGSAVSAEEVDLARVNVLGVGIHAVNLSSALEAVLAAVLRPRSLGYVTVTGVHGVMESQHDEALKRIHNRSYLSLPDGTPIAWIGRARGQGAMRQVAGPDFMPALLACTACSGERHFFWGSANGVVETLVERLRARHPQLAIVGGISPPFRPLTPDEELELVDRIIATKPHVFWVGLSTPKQERFMAGFIERHGERLRSDDQGLLMIGVGAAFDFQAGIVKEAPRWMRGTGLEWLYRLAAEPRRLWRRYLNNNPRFVMRVALQAISPTRYPMLGARHR